MCVVSQDNPAQIPETADILVGGSGWSPLLTHDLLMVSRSDLDNPVSQPHSVHTLSRSLYQRLKLSQCLKSRPFVLHFLSIWMATYKVLKMFSEFLQQRWKTHFVLFDRWLPISHFFCSTCYSLYVSVHAGMNVQFVSNGFRRPTPAGDLQSASLSWGEDRRDETESRGPYSAPRHCSFKLF